MICFSVSIVAVSRLKNEKSSVLLPSFLRNSFQFLGILSEDLTPLRLPLPLILRVYAFKLPCTYLSYTTFILCMLCSCAVMYGKKLVKHNLGKLGFNMFTMAA